MTLDFSVDKFGFGATGGGFTNASNVQGNALFNGKLGIERFGAAEIAGTFEITDIGEISGAPEQSFESLCFVWSKLLRGFFPTMRFLDPALQYFCRLRFPL